MAKAQIWQTDAGRYAVIYCPGCDRTHTITIRPAPSPSWTFNDDPDKPTFHPSLLCNKKGPHHHPGTPVCHSWIKDGRIQFLNDSTHGLAGKTVDLPDYYEEF